VELQLQARNGSEIEASGSFVLQLSAFRITRPALLGMAIKDKAPIQFQSVWRK
jgi:hypothetical protein